MKTENQSIAAVAPLQEVRSTVAGMYTLVKLMQGEALSESQKKYLEPIEKAAEYLLAMSSKKLFAAEVGNKREEKSVQLSRLRQRSLPIVIPRRLPHSTHVALPVSA